MEQSKEKMLSIDAGVFEALEKDFRDIMVKLAGDKSLEKFRWEYEKLFRAVYKSHESERRLMSKCRELNAEIVANSAKVATAIKLNEKDQATIDSLRKETEKALKLNDFAKESEVKDKEKIESLQVEIAGLTRKLEQSAGLSANKENNVQELLREKEKLTQERDALLINDIKLREEIKAAQDKHDKMEKTAQLKETEIYELQKEKQRKQIEAYREQRQKESLQRDLDQSKHELEEKVKELQSSKNDLEKFKLDFEKSTNLTIDLRAEMDEQTKQEDVLKVKLHNLEERLKKQDEQCNVLSKDKHLKIEELKKSEAELAVIKNEQKKLERLREEIARKLTRTENQKLEIDEERNRLLSKIHSLKNEIEAQRILQAEDKKRIEGLERELELLKREEMHASEFADMEKNLRKAHKQTVRDLEQEIAHYNKEAIKQRNIIEAMERERNRYVEETADLTQKLLCRFEDLKVREMQIFEYKKKIAEVESNLKVQQNIQEKVEEERNDYVKEVIEMQGTITKQKRTIKSYLHQIDKLLVAKAENEEALKNQLREQEFLSRDKTALNQELKKHTTEMASIKKHIDSQEAEYRKLLKVIAEADQERLRQKKELDQVISERDILGTQLVRRNDMLALLYEKIRVQQSILNRGEAQYMQRLEDIRVLKLEIRKRRCEKALLQRNVGDANEMRRKVCGLQSELLKERTRCRALEEELENPVNVHRWRKLEGSDPSTYEMIQKIAMLQKRLIAKTEEVVENELLISEKERLYIELKDMLARQPSPEVAEQINAYQQTLKEKTKQLKSMASELNMYESQIQEYKYEIERVSRELIDVKKNYYAQKRKEQLSNSDACKDKQQGLQPDQLQNVSDHQLQFLGGGFNLSRAPPPSRLSGASGTEGGTL